MTQENNTVGKKVYSPIKLSLLGNIEDLTQGGYGNGKKNDYRHSNKNHKRRHHYGRKDR